MEDGGYIGVRPNTQMRIANYKAEGGPDDQSVISLLQGSFRSITGWIGKLGGSNYRIVTRTVTIRGSRHRARTARDTGGKRGRRAAPRGAQRHEAGLVGAMLTVPFGVCITVSPLCTRS